ncbi:MAG TPA: ABC transporter permease [Acetobacteraceae bacterium]|jgi:peptide/nickel transport system permease protein|nr:ABC transporter permease [Acetobacteraceae bacterium]
MQLDATVAAGAVEERIAVASNWTLIWWRFRRHRLALFSAGVLICLYIVVLCPDFFATQDPQQTDARQAFIPTQPLHLFDGGWNPWVPAIVGKRNPITLRMEWTTDPSRKTHIEFFTHGQPYRVLGLFTTSIHLIGATDPAQRIFLLGSDRLGRDQWSRIMHGTQTSMTVGLVAVTLSVILGVVLGGISGYFGGIIDQVIQRLIELLQSVPTIPVWLALSAALPRDWTPTQVFLAITVILSLVGWTTLGREVRGRFLALREEDFVLAARLAGCGRMRIILRHMMPTFLSHIIATSSLAIPVAIISETSLSFLGLGIRPPAISWGVLLQEAQNIQTLALAPWLLIPGLVVIVAVLAFNLVGDGLRDASDPYSH